MRTVLAGILAIVLGAPSTAGDRPDAKQALALARAYAVKWQDTLANLVADEDYTQEVRLYTRAASGRDQPLMPTKRRLLSEILLVQAPADQYWLSFRDVMKVDGATVPNRQQRFHDLFGSPAAAVISTARLMAQESARYNLGRLFRTTNTPTAALVFLQSRHAANSSWRLDTNERLDGRTTWMLRFEQRKPPYAIELSGGRVFPPSGCFWLEPSTGTILQSELTVKGGYSASTRTRFDIVPSIDGMVPVRMEDEYNLPGIEVGRGSATYTNHRLFRTAGRIIGH
jgi:hypothetical protein